MKESFDPYRKWLGILPEDQPPHHYRLLGIEPFESDPEVIVNAADGRMAQIKNFQIGKYSELSQRILNEIAAAKICLLNAEKKRQYDRKLRPRLEAEKEGLPIAVPPVSPPSRPPPSSTAQAAPPAIETSSVFSYVSAHSPPRRSWLIPGALGLGAVAIIAALVAVIGRGKGPQVAEPPVSSYSEPAKRPAESLPLPTPPDQDRRASPPAVRAAKLVQPPASPPVQSDVTPPAGDPGRPLADLLDPLDPDQKGDREAGVVTSAVSERSRRPEAAAAATKRLSPPDDQARREAELRAREIFKRELAEAATPEQKLALARKLADQAEKAADDAAARFVLTRLACEKAAEAGALSGTMDLADRLQQLYDIDLLSFKADLLDKVATAMGAGAAAAARSQGLVDQATSLADEAVAADNLDLAGRFVTQALSAARKMKDTALLYRLQAREREVGRMKTRYLKVRKALEALAASPTDREANLLAGRWYCFDVGNWSKGLPLLAKGADARLARLAEQDLAHPEEARQQVLLADRWYSLAKREKGPQQRGIHARAQYWYELAVPGLSGLDKTGVEKRLAELAAGAGFSGPKTRGVVQKGNVALATNGTTVRGVAMGASNLLDGDSVHYHGGAGYASGTFPCEWTVTFDKVYSLQEIRFLLWDRLERYYRYAIAVSADGKNYVPLVDRSQGEWRSWQRMTFSPRPVKAVKLIGLYDSANSGFHVVEFEAYCIPPPLPPK